MLDLLALITAVAAIVLAVRIIRTRRRDLDRAPVAEVIELDAWRVSS